MIDIEDSDVEDVCGAEDNLNDKQYMGKWIGSLGVCIVECGW